MRRHSGFTFIELLVVIAIISILTAILFPIFAQARAKARQATCLSNLKQIGLALGMYLQDYDETYPNIYGFGRYWNWHAPRFAQVDPRATVAAYADPVNPWWMPNKLQPYVRSAAIFYCPSVNPSQPINTCLDASPAIVNAYSRNETSYIFMAAVACTTAPVPKPSDPRYPGYCRGLSAHVPGYAPIRLSEISRPAEAMFAMDMPYWKDAASTRCFGQPPHADGLNTGYMDGHAKFVGFRAAGTDLWTDNSWHGYFDDM